MDRTLSVPPHHGENVLPNFPLFSKLLRLAHRLLPPIAVKDIRAGVERNYLDLLIDALRLRNALQRQLSAETLIQLEREDEVFIGLLAAGGYEYTVGFLAILALGAAVVPIGMSAPTPQCQLYTNNNTTAVTVPVQEATYFMRTAQCSALLSTDATLPLAQETITSLRDNPASPQNPSIPLLHISTHIAQQSATTVADPTDIVISSSPFLDLNKAGLVIFTSGTTGPPKGVVHRRGQLTENAEIVAEQYRLTDNDTAQHLLPVHHATGIGITLLPYLITGACVEFRSGGFDPAWTWDSWRRGGITVFSGVPTMYTRLKQYFEEMISLRSLEEQNEYIAGARRLRILLCGTSALPSSVQAFWTKLLGGKPILTRYGATEIGSIFKVDLQPGADLPANSVGRLEPGVSVKLSEEGLLQVKGPLMFSKYAPPLPYGWF